jgi:hypothetical protein
MSDQAPRPPFEPLLRMLDHQLTASELSALADRLRTDEAACREAAGLLLQIGVLGEMAREPGDVRLPRRPSLPASRWRRRTVAVVAACASLAAALILVLGWRRPPAHVRAPARHPAFARPAVPRAVLPEIAPTAGGRRVLFVRGGEPNVTPAGDAPMVARLEKLGFDVTEVVDGGLSASDLPGKDLVVISASTLGKMVRERLPVVKLRDAPVPVVTCETSTFDLLGMTAPRLAEGAPVRNGFGSAPGHDTVQIEARSHALAAGLTGTVSVATAAVALSWGEPSESAIRVASVGRDRRMSAQFAYERGATMIGLTAPARRVACFISAEAGEVLTAEGWALFDAGVRWASGL